MHDEKVLMSEAAILYYEKKCTQQEIADLLKLSRQTVSKLLSDAVKENIVEFRIHNPEKDAEELKKRLCETFGIRNCVVCRVSHNDDALRSLMTVKAAVEYVLPLLKKGNLNIGVSWGRTIQEFIRTIPETATNGNTVFPLFGATDNETSYFSSNELARNMADKIGAKVKYAWFPYLADSNEDRELLKHLSYYKKTQDLWNTADLVILGIGNTTILDVFGKTFGYSEKHAKVIGDVATHFYDIEGRVVPLYENTLCASVDNLKNAKETVAIAYGGDKVEAIIGALRTGMIRTLITDEYTARQLLEN